MDAGASAVAIPCEESSMSDTFVGPKPGRGNLWLRVVAARVVAVSASGGGQ